MNEFELLQELCKAYKNYIDSSIDMTEQDRSDLLMIARNLEISAQSAGII